MDTGCCDIWWTTHKYSIPFRDCRRKSVTLTSFPSSIYHNISTEIRFPPRDTVSQDNNWVGPPETGFHAQWLILPIAQISSLSIPDGLILYLNLTQRCIIFSNPETCLPKKFPCFNQRNQDQFPPPHHSQQKLVTRSFKKNPGPLKDDSTDQFVILGYSALCFPGLCVLAPVTFSVEREK